MIGIGMLGGMLASGFASIPILAWKILALVLLASSLWIGGCMHGKKEAEQKLAVLESSMAAAAKVMVQNARQREREEISVVLQENDRNEKAILANHAIAESELERLRKSAGSTNRRPISSVPKPATTTTYCLGASGPTRDELLGYGQTVVRILREATDDRSALEACIASWPSRGRLKLSDD